MKKRFPLFWKLYPPFLMIVLIPLLAASWYADFSMRRFFMDQMATNLGARANLLKDQMTAYLMAEDWKNIDLLCKRAGIFADTRITVILPFGKVLGDSDADPKTMENHSDRQEFVKAMSGETGVFTRQSDTLREPMMYLAVPLIEGEKRIGILIVLNDVTRVRRLENMRKDFAANVSHEIKTPLTAIKGFVETLKTGALNRPEEAAKFLGIIEKHTNRLNAIIDDLMKLSLIEQKTDKKEILLENRLLLPILQSARQLCQSMADEKAIQILLLCEETLSINLNAALIEQAFANLLDNAVKYSEPGGSIEIKATKTDAGVAVSFQDHGIGIAPEHLPRLFERFYRADPSRSRKLGGTGLGLAIVKHIVNAHGGKMTVESAPGKGSEFIVHIPS